MINLGLGRIFRPDRELMNMKNFRFFPRLISLSCISTISTVKCTLPRTSGMHLYQYRASFRELSRTREIEPHAWVVLEKLAGNFMWLITTDFHMFCFGYSVGLMHASFNFLYIKWSLCQITNDDCHDGCHQCDHKQIQDYEVKKCSSFEIYILHLSTYLWSQIPFLICRY